MTSRYPYPKPEIALTQPNPDRQPSYADKVLKDAYPLFNRVPSLPWLRVPESNPYATLSVPQTSSISTLSYNYPDTVFPVIDPNK